MYKGFDEEKFINYTEGEFNGITTFAREMLSNLIEYAYKHEQASKDQFCEFLVSIIPEIEFGEVAMFMEDECLTEEGRKLKREFMEANNHES